MNVDNYLPNRQRVAYSNISRKQLIKYNKLNFAFYSLHPQQLRGIASLFRCHTGPEHSSNMPFFYLQPFNFEHYGKTHELYCRFCQIKRGFSITVKICIILVNRFRKCKITKYYYSFYQFRLKENKPDMKRKLLNDICDFDRNSADEKLDNVTVEWNEYLSFIVNVSFEKNYLII